MNLIFQILLIAYLFLGVPFHLGILAASIFRKDQKKMSEIITNGYLVMLACFWPIAVAAVNLEWSLKRLAIVWVVFSVVVSLLAILFGRGQIKAFFTMLTEYWGIRKRYALMALLTVFAVLSVLFTRPSPEDATLEIVHTAVSTDTMYVYDEYTGYISEYAMNGHVYSPIEMLYAVGAELTGISIPFMLYYMIPFCLLLFFYMVLWKVGTGLFEKEEQIISFVAIVTGIYGMTTYLEGQSVVTGIFLNSWNGLTLLSCVVMPAAFAACLEVMNEAINEGKIEHRIEKICMAVVLLLAGQLTNARGGFYIALMLIVTLAVIIVRKGYDYVVTSGRFKKRV